MVVIYGESLFTYFVFNEYRWKLEWMNNGTFNYKFTYLIVSW